MPTDAPLELDPAFEPDRSLLEDGPGVAELDAEAERELGDQGGPRAERDAALLQLETDDSLRAMIDAPAGDVSETTRELARLELESRGQS